MEKLSAAEVFAVFRTIPETLRKLASERDAYVEENDRLRRELAEYKLNERVEKIAQEMHRKGIEQGRTLDDTRELLLQKAASGQLDIVEQAVEMTVRQQPFATLGEIPRGGESSFEEYVLS